MATSGCAQLIGIDVLPDLPVDAQPVDARIDPPDATLPLDGCESWTPKPRHFEPCALPAPLGALNLDMPGEYGDDTDQVILRDPAGNEIAHASVELPGFLPIRAISVEALRVSDVFRLRAVGSQPLLVASWSEIVVEGAIDVSSNATTGAGANTGECAAPGEGGQGNEGGGGGGGGGFHGSGGDGGNGAGGGPAAMAATSCPRPVALRGGCRPGEAPILQTPST